MSNNKPLFDHSSAGTPASQSGNALSGQPPWMKNTTPNAKMVSVGFAKVENDPAITPKDVRIPMNYLKK